MNQTILPTQQAEPTLSRQQKVEEGADLTGSLGFWAAIVATVARVVVMACLHTITPANKRALS